MQESLLASVVQATESARAEGAGALSRFLTARTFSESLSAWLALDGETRPPSRAELVLSLQRARSAIDRLLAEQVDAILHHPSFQGLEAGWRGLFLLCDQAIEAENVRVKVLDVSWRDLVRDLERALEFDQSQLFRKVYSQEFGMPGGDPMGVLLGNYSLHPKPGSGHPTDDVGALDLISQVAAAAFAPFIAAAHPSFFEFEHWSELERPIELGLPLRQKGYEAWGILRAKPDTNFVALVLPRILMRRPYGHDREKPHDPLRVRVDGFPYVERVGHPDRSDHLWGHAIWAFGAVLVRAFAENGWFAGIRGTEPDRIGGGLVECLPRDWHGTDAAGLVAKPSTEVQVTDAREKELSDLGFLPLVHMHGTPYAAFFACQSIQRPAVFDKREATLSSHLKSMMHYTLCVARIAHYVKVLARDKIGKFSTAGECKRFLEDWLSEYAARKDELLEEERTRYPLSEYKVEVRENPSKPGSFFAVLHLVPHVQLDHVSAEIAMRTELAGTYTL